MASEVLAESIHAESEGSKVKDDSLLSLEEDFKRKGDQCVMARQRCGLLDVLLLAERERCVRTQIYRDEELAFHASYTNSEFSLVRSSKRLDTYKEELKEIESRLLSLSVLYDESVFLLSECERMHRESSEELERRKAC